jgi:NAD(P)-dependent dehydrogenase (short-subunit alcohol dehydrogenase family)
MPSIFDVRSSNAGLLTPPTSVAIIVGGASGIGQGIAEAFARYVQGNIIVIGDNSFAAGPMLSKLTKLRDDTDAKHEFIQSDVTLMRNVRAVARQVLSREPKINFLVMAPGTMTARGREETNEGIDKELALHYYSRWMLIRDLLPGLLKAKEAGEDARVLSVLGAGKGGAIDLKDLKMENQKFWSSTSTLKRASTYTDLMIEVTTFWRLLLRLVSDVTITGVFSSKSWPHLCPCLPGKRSYSGRVALRVRLFVHQSGITHSQ